MPECIGMYPMLLVITSENERRRVRLVLSAHASGRSRRLAATLSVADRPREATARARCREERRHAPGARKARAGRAASAADLPPELARLVGRGALLSSAACVCVCLVHVQPMRPCASVLGGGACLGASALLKLLASLVPARLPTAVELSLRP